MQMRDFKEEIPFPIHLGTTQTAMAFSSHHINNKSELGKGGGHLYSLPCSLFIFFIFIRRF